jgi:tetratricopeptide (TPR) repeat protein
LQAPTPRERHRRPRKLSATLKQLDRELKQLRTSAAGAAESAASASMPTQSAGHIEQLVRMRQATISQQKQKPQAEVVVTRSAAELFRSAQDALREQQFGRAQEIMRKACEAEPKNEIYSMYCMWAELRSNVLSEEGIIKLRQILREKISDDQHKAFAYYALGHISLFEKKEEAAEKFFRKAVELNKHNQDAERHLRVLELRRKTAVQEKSSKIFGIDIKSKKS